MESKGRRGGKVGDVRLGLGRDPWLKAEEGWGRGLLQRRWRNGISQRRVDKESAQWEGKFLSLPKSMLESPLPEVSHHFKWSQVYRLTEYWSLNGL